jgi:ABC-type multidrug transport system fused ATPase/permease subunit
MKAKLFLRFATYLKPYWRKELILLLLMILASAGTLVSPYVLKIIIDTVFPARDYSLLIQVLAVLLAIHILRLGINYLSDYLFAWIGNHVTRDIRMDLFNHLLQLPVSFYNKNKAGDLVHRVNSEVNSIQSILTGTMVRLINSSCSIIGLTVMLCILNWRLFLLSMAVMPFIFVNTRRFQPKIQKNIKKSREKDSDILIDNNTACASEAFIETMRKHANAIIIGKSKTKGAYAKLTQIIFPSGIILYTHLLSNKYFTATGENIEYSGISSDIWINIGNVFDLYPYNDISLDTAIKILNNQ